MADTLLLEASSTRAIHLFDNGNLTFTDIKSIFSAASDGKLEGVEKTGGQHILISFSVKDGQLKCARTKADIKSGGVSLENAAKGLEPEAKNVFLNAARLLEKTIQSLNHDEQSNLFGDETNIFYSCSVLGGNEADNLNYDTKAIIVNKDGHLLFSRKENKFSDAGVGDKFKSLQGVINDSQEQLKQDNYSVQVNAIKKLKALADKKPYNTAISKLNSLLSTVNNLIKNDSLSLSEDSSISEFMIARVYILINAVLQQGKIKNFDPIVKMNIAKRILGVKGISVKDISSKISKEQLSFIKDNLLNDTSRNEILKTAILPLETIINDFAVEVLKGLQSAFILDTKKESERLKQSLKTAIEALQSSGNESLMKDLRQQMYRLRSIDSVDTAVEGFVFDYDGVTYKFSGNFSPISNILNLFKINSPTPINEAVKKSERIALVPGAFKPPHKGHLEMIKKYAKMADKVIILLSPLPRQMPNGQEVTAEISKKIWNIFLDAEGLSKKVLIMDSPWSSPVHAAHKFIENEENRPDFAQPGQTIILGSSTKGNDNERFRDNYMAKYSGRGVNIELAPFVATEEMSATGMRDAISKKDQDSLMSFLPSSVNRKKVSAEILSLFDNGQQNIQESYIYDIINEEITKKGNKYCLVSIKKHKNLGCYDSKAGAEKREKQVQYFKHVKKENMAGGAVAGAVGKPIDLTKEK
jgi:cytidyltransferase-like protein